uniref:Glutamate/phenylalanine/leucine/valine/L-tryptophan dehydrogenase C-terminal domain-containing protein n=1 Tax=Lotharella oceanica TaxID=641309 RepID=A0A7S2U2N6_9EUKA
MSSKPLTGINHKEYGVTSEGVCIFLDVALRNMGKDPTNRPFTLKMTGGTSGDVAGNAIKILKRDYGENAKIVGIVDHKGCVEDPRGLSLTELMRLVDHELALDNFDQSKLSSDGKYWSRDDPEGVVMCDSMHNRLQTDAFLPAGGLPNTIRTDNWESFLNEDGKVSSPLIVEAANIFIEQQARVKLTENGVLIVKDSSANKCGVICSAMEIIAHLLMTEDEFMAFRPTYVDDVLQHLRALASKEATIMFDEYKKGDGTWETSLPGIAERISRVMNYSSDHISAQLTDCLDRQHILELASSALLPSLREKAGDRLGQLPPGYIINMVAKHLSSQLVYHEGLDYVERSIPQDKFALVAVQYAEETKRVWDMVDAVSKADIASGSKEEIVELLRLGGPRIAVSRSRVFAPKAE